jgi:D-glycero-alpha-D-manno-heptose 1-phosphate guanylyltransferase
MLTNEAIVLAGGLGTRLQHVLPDIPKCMAPINGKPFLAFVLDYLENQNIDKVILSVGFRKEQIINYFGASYRSLKIVYSIENEPLGTGGAIKQALDYCTNKLAFIVNGDTCFKPDLAAMSNLHQKAEADITIAVKHMADSSRYGLVVADLNSKIVEFREKEKLSAGGWINGGIYLVRKALFDTFQQQKFSIENDVFKVSCDNLRFHAFQTDAFFLDIGIPADYCKAQILLNAITENE